MPIDHCFPHRIVDTRHQRGDWVQVVEDADALHVVVGRTGNRLDGRQPSRRREWRVTVIGGRVEVLGVFPVRELLTHEIGAVVAGLTGALADAEAYDRVVEAVAQLTDVDHDTLDGVLWRAAFPLLRPVLEREPGPTPASVPEALDPLLRAETVRMGVQRLFGRVTRPLVRATATRLLPEDAVAPIFDPLVYAAMAAGVCGPERLVEIIDTTPVQPASARFTVADVHRARHAFARERPTAVVAILQDALQGPAGRGRLFQHLAQWSPPRPPAPPPATHTPTRPPAAATVADRPRPTPAPAPAGTRPIAYPARWLAAEGHTVAGHTIVLPHTADELARWGGSLDNCLASYNGAVLAGRSRLLGLRSGPTLRFAVEVTPGGTIRQIEAPGNRQPAPAVGQEIARGLVAMGLAHADGRTGRSLLAPR